jgi:hypothetical protein
MSYSGFGGGRIKIQVQISLRVRIFSWVLYYHRTLPTATSVFVREALKGADQSDRAKKKNEKIALHGQGQYRTAYEKALQNKENSNIQSVSGLLLLSLLSVEQKGCRLQYQKA